MESRFCIHFLTYLLLLPAIVVGGILCSLSHGVVETMTKQEISTQVSRTCLAALTP